MDYKSFMELGVKRNSLEYHKIFRWILVPPNTISPSSVEFRRTLEIHHFHWHQVPLNFHGIFHEIPWNFVAKSDVIKIHGLSWNLVIADLNDILFPRTSMEFSIEVHGTSRVAIPNITRVPGNSIELGWCHFKWNRVPWNSMEFHRTLWREFHIWTILQNVFRIDEIPDGDGVGNPSLSLLLEGPSSHSDNVVW